MRQNVKNRYFGAFKVKNRYFWHAYTLLTVIPQFFALKMGQFLFSFVKCFHFVKNIYSLSERWKLRVWKILRKTETHWENFSCMEQFSTFILGAKMWKTAVFCRLKQWKAVILGDFK